MREYSPLTLTLLEPGAPIPYQLGHTRCEEHGQHGAAVGRRGDPQRKSLVRWRIGSTRDGKGHRKTGSRYTEQQPHCQHLSVT